MEGEIKLSVILAVYNKENSILPVFNLLVSTIENQIKVKEYELIFVDDFSIDNSVEILRQLSSHPKAVIEIHPKNLGQLKSLETGLRTAKGKIIVMSSCDLQNPLSKTTELYAAVEAGYDCAIAYRSERRENGINSFLSSIFLYMLSAVFPKFPKGGFDFVAFNAKIREDLLHNDFNQIFLQLELLRTAKSIFQLPVTREKDSIDGSSWNLKKRIKYAMKAIRYIKRH
jgi:glycosyltransferase involved in cell wall biosynthesis